MSIKILNQADTADLIERVVTGSRTLVGDIHQALVSSLDHVREHNNTTGLLRLLNGMSNGVRVQGMAAWIKGFSNKKCAPGQNPKTKVWKIELNPDRTDEDFDIEGASEVPFNEFTVEPSHNTLTLKKFVKGLKRTASNTACYPGTTVPKVSESTRALAMALVQSIPAETMLQILN